MTSTNISTPTLKVGAKGAAVKDLQELLLQRVGVGGLSADGDFGPATEQAVKAFQQKPPLGGRSLSPVDGIVGSQTWQALIGLVTRVSHHFL